ncbi:MAG: hypothetical protein ACREN4_06190 [Candidatus Dormibacteria bacterium]
MSSEPREPRTEVHLITGLGDERAWRHCHGRADHGARVLVVLLHDAVLETEGRLRGPKGGAELAVAACTEHARRRQLPERWALIDYAEIIARCATAQQVVSW